MTTEDATKPVQLWYRWTSHMYGLGKWHLSDGLWDRSTGTATTFCKRTFNLPLSVWKENPKQLLCRNCKKLIPS